MIDRATLQQICEQGLQAVGYDLVELEYQREQQGMVLRVFIDHLDSKPSEPSSGITHGDCAAASRHLGTLLDVEDPIDGAYRLEVSSPGIPRPLRRERDFQRFRGGMVRVELNDAQDGRRNFNGQLTGADQGQITVEVDGSEFTLPIAGIRRARLLEEPER